MPLQNKVNINPALGIPGSRAAYLGTAYTVHQYISDGTAEAGKFAFLSTATENTGGAAVGGGTVGIVGGAESTPIGLITREITAALPIGTAAGLTYPQGANVAVAVRGQFYIQSPSAAVVGQKVLTSLTGEISLGDSVTSGTIDTGWTVATGCDTAGSIIVIQNLG